MYSVDTHKGSRIRGLIFQKPRHYLYLILPFEHQKDFLTVRGANAYPKIPPVSSTQRSFEEERFVQIAECYEQEIYFEQYLYISFSPRT